MVKTYELVLGIDWESIEDKFGHTSAYVLEDHVKGAYENIIGKGISIISIDFHKSKIRIEVTTDELNKGFEDGYRKYGINEMIYTVLHPILPFGVSIKSIKEDSNTDLMGLVYRRLGEEMLDRDIPIPEPAKDKIVSKVMGKVLEKSIVHDYIKDYTEDEVTLYLRNKPKKTVTVSIEVDEELLRRLWDDENPNLSVQQIVHEELVWSVPRSMRILDTTEGSSLTVSIMQLVYDTAEAIDAPVSEEVARNIAENILNNDYVWSSIDETVAEMIKESAYNE